MHNGPGQGFPDQAGRASLGDVHHGVKPLDPAWRNPGAYQPAPFGNLFVIVF